MNKNNLQFKNKGFTLVEIMVATSIFVVVMLISIGSLVIASDGAKKSQALQSAMDNVNFAMDSMTRSLRVGINYSCITSDSFDLSSLPMNNDCALPLSGSGGGGSGIAFTPANTPPNRIAYALIDNVLKRCDPECISLVADNVNIETLKFFVNGSSISDKIQPSVYIIMKGTITIKGQPTSFSIQTMASQRSVE